MGTKYGDIRYKWLAENGYDVKKDTLQQSYVRSLLAPVSEIQGVFCEADAGTGKTTLAIMAGVNGLQNEEYSKLIYIRSAREAGEKLGFLPGTLEEKTGPYMKPFFKTITKAVGERTVAEWLAVGKIEALTTTFEIGETYENAFVIIDEAQLLSVNELQLIHTRPDSSTKMVTVGSTKQTHDLVKKIEGFTPFEIMMRHYGDMAEIHTLEKNFRGMWSLHGDKVSETIERLKREATQ